MVTGDALTGGTAAVAGGLAVWNTRAWLMQGEVPGRPLHGAVMRHIRPAAFASKRRFTRRHIGREGLRAALRAFIQGIRREYA